MEQSELWEFWEKLLAETKNKFDPYIWSNYIQTGLFPRYIEDNILFLGATNIHIKNFLEKNSSFMSLLVTTSRQLSQTNLQIKIVFNEINQDITPDTTVNQNSQYIYQPEESLDINTDTNSSTSDIYDDAYPMEITISRSNTKIQNIMPNNFDNNMFPNSNSFNNTFETTNSINNFEQPHTKLNPDYTFETFITGNSNRIAYSAAQAVAEMPGKKYNPLFIYGPPGLGKTHLMHAIGNYVKKHHPHLKVICATSEDFLNDLINAIKSKKNESFRERYRNVDILLIDDIQFLQQKDFIKEEFFHTFNALINDNKQIVLISDKPPKDLTYMEERLRSRFESGFVSTIDFPDLETRIAILRFLIDKQIKINPNIYIPNDVINYIASTFSKNIRSLEGAFNNMLFNSSISNSPITKESTMEILKNLVDSSQNKQISIPVIQDFIANYFKIKKEELLGNKRTKQLAHARQIAMYLCRELINESYPQIASSFGKKDHTTVLHAYDKITKEMDNNKEIKEMIKDITDQLSK